MATLASHFETKHHHPLDVVERIVAGYEWPSERTTDTEIAVQAPGRWCDYSLFFTWSESASAVQLTCAFDLRVPRPQRAKLFELLTLANENLWLGHFMMWMDEGLPIFRHAVPLRGTKGPTAEQVVDMMDTALYECERFYPAFQYVIWGGREPQEAITASLIETVGEA